jgi:hypothetical protein
VPVEIGIPQLQKTYPDMDQGSVEDVNGWLQELCLAWQPSSELYDKLPSDEWFRLLFIEPGSPKDVLQCQLIPVQLGLAKSRYEALSYCWSEGTGAKCGVVCNGLQIDISEPLSEALQHIRHPRLLRVIWADALCINQGDNGERSQQVSIMHSVYGNAFRTLVWLGTSCTGTTKALNLICDVVNAWDETHPAEFSVFDPESDTTETHKSTEPCPQDIPDLAFTLSGVFSRKWFQRRWVIQEVILAQSVQLVIGYHTISWYWVGLGSALFRTQYTHLINSSESFSELSRNTMNAYFMFRLSRQCDFPSVKLSLLQLFRLTASFETSEPLDTVFALRGLAECVEGIDAIRRLKIDYALREAELLKLVAELLIEEGRKGKRPLNFLSDAGMNQGRPRLQRPIPGCNISWIPRWTRNVRSLLEPWDLHGGFNASHGLEFNRCNPSDPIHLAVEGISVSTVLWRGGNLYNSAHEQSSWSVLNGSATEDILFLLKSKACVPAASETVDHSFTPTVLEAFSRVLTAGRDVHGRRETDPSKALGPFAASLCFDFWEEGFSAERQVLDDLARGAHPASFTQIAETVGLNRSLFVTIGGHLGIGPVEMLAGDEVYVLAGSGMPFVLRKEVTESNGILYRLVGECFVDGIMGGEAVNAMKEGRIHRGPFLPHRLFSKLYQFPSLMEGSEEIIRRMTKEALLLYRQKSKKLQLSLIEIL